MEDNTKSSVLIESLKYIIVGCLTTVLNIAIFSVLSIIFNKNFPDFKYNWFLAEVPAFIIAVLFAFFMDKYFVFKTGGHKILQIIQELSNFFMMRIVSELVNVFGMFVLVNIFKFKEIYSKIGLSFVVVVLNYLFSKFFIFKKK